MDVVPSLPYCPTLKFDIIDIKKDGVASVLGDSVVNHNGCLSEPCYYLDLNHNDHIHNVTFKVRTHIKGTKTHDSDLVTINMGCCVTSANMTSTINETKRHWNQYVTPAPVSFEPYLCDPYDCC